MTEKINKTTTAKEIFDAALSLLGYKDDSVFHHKAIAAFNKVLYEMYRAINTEKEFEPISTLSEEINLPNKVLFGVMPLGIAEQLALSEGDGEQQQYFVVAYERAKAKLNRIDQIHDILP